MKRPGHSAQTVVTRQRPRQAEGLAPRPRGHLAAVKLHSRAQEKKGAYKRVEIFLGVEAAIALRRLMRDGRSAREVIEALLLGVRPRGEESEPPGASQEP